MLNRRQAAYDFGRSFVSEVSEELHYLKERWADEHEYEPWADYAAQMTKIAKAHNLEVLSTSKRPFGLTFRYMGQVATVTVGSRHITLIWHN